MITISIRETVKVKNHELFIRLPETFNCEEVDVIIFPRMKDVSWDVWQGSEMERIGRIGCSSRSFVEDPEDVVLVFHSHKQKKPQRFRILGNFKGKIRMADDFDKPLGDEFWLGESNEIPA